jgi:hypothetical protein
VHILVGVYKLTFIYNILAPCQAQQEARAHPATTPASGCTPPASPHRPSSLAYASHWLRVLSQSSIQALGAPSPAPRGLGPHRRQKIVCGSPLAASVGSRWAAVRFKRSVNTKQNFNFPYTQSGGPKGCQTQPSRQMNSPAQLGGVEKRPWCSWCTVQRSATELSTFSTCSHNRSVLLCTVSRCDTASKPSVPSTLSCSVRSC